MEYTLERSIGIKKVVLYRMGNGLEGSSLVYLGDEETIGMVLERF
jgi:hypothetical protein